jgi:hypothetical protein
VAGGGKGSFSSSRKRAEKVGLGLKDHLLLSFLSDVFMLEVLELHVPSLWHSVLPTEGADKAESSTYPRAITVEDNEM